MLCSRGRKSSISWFDCEPHYYSLYWAGHGDQRDVSSKNSEGSGGWSHSRDEGTGGHNRVHQAGADSKSAWRAKPLLLWSIGSQQMRRSLSAKLAQRGSGISMSVILNKPGELFVLFFLYCLSSPFPPPSLSAPAGFSQLSFLSGSG